MPARDCHHACTMKTHQFTVRAVPDSVSRALKRMARDRGISLNRLLVGALEAAAGAGAEAPRQHDLDAFSGSWVKDPKVDRALAELRRVDERDWR